ncbi:MAG: TetR/AcrR family transcriptional regulator [Pseudomonadales bacterium]|nr:TetR/AcrR family transcriptional regulator [Pseudomonadales bacterium]MBO6700875.1 TetR/AcrR family transcriptional regulator [Pseudomonadales bacterium]MBO7007826.1 TetR/AcrR family transcriptional regulator [Pseudomonadales bacterium]
MSEARQYHHGDLRAAILERATEVIEQDGIEALSLRGIARDLGVSHAAPNRHFRTKADLLSSLARVGWEQITEATLRAAEDVRPNDSHHRLNAMGRGFLKWALLNRSMFAAVTHPDVERHADDDLKLAIDDFQRSVRDAVVATQREGRLTHLDPAIATLYTNSVPFGLAMSLKNPLFGTDLSERDIDELVANLIELVVPTS